MHLSKQIFMSIYEYILVLQTSTHLNLEEKQCKQSLQRQQTLRLCKLYVDW